ncbi:MAG: class I SAM-dependent RNA methyltransferase [Rhizobiaceae bacterium]|nr:class I SAM-dependent RNA methyltransferase [Rhizobiaceae bacterium]
MSETLVIDRLGAQGDGIADRPGAAVYVPFALPGETVAVARDGDHARLLDIVAASPDRIEPVCRHFSTCGGCAVQHLAKEPYRDWKRDKVVQSLSSRGIEAPVGETIGIEPRTRRRAVFSARATSGGMLFGYNQAGSNAIVDLVECLVSVPAIAEAIGRLRLLAALVSTTRDPFHVTVMATASGLDIAVDGCGKLTEGLRRQALEFALRERFARLTVDGELIVEPSRPAVHFGRAVVSPPAGGFLQAVAQAEEAMAGLVSAHLKRAKKVADLFAGAGAFTFRLAEKSEVHAVEGDAPALASLDRAARATTGLKRITHERRDLFRRPLTFKELNAFDGVVFDPPRAGAEDQCVQLARSDVPYVAAVSCNPATLARDLRILIDGGYALRGVTPLDQFLWSPHVEAVALLEKPKRRR